MREKILLTGCAGFIGSNFLKKISANHKEVDFVVIDALTYSGHYPSIAKEIEENEHLSFEKIDIRDRALVNELFDKYNFNGVIHFAAESHVDNSIKNPNIFIETNIIGTMNLLNSSLKRFNDSGIFKYLQISTDEVYGDLNLTEPAFTELHNLSPSSPYSASKASADLLVESYFKTFKLPTLITRCSNNYGPYQYPEKLIPLMISKALNNEKLPVYGKGQNVRDWIHVDDHNEAVWLVYQKGNFGNVYNIGGSSEKANIDVVKDILSLLDKNEELISFVEDRLGHDFRYSIDYSKIHNELNWKPKINFQEGLKATVAWYKNNPEWIKALENNKL